MCFSCACLQLTHAPVPGQRKLFWLDKHNPPPSPKPLPLSNCMPRTTSRAPFQTEGEFQLKGAITTCSCGAAHMTFLCTDSRSVPMLSEENRKNSAAPQASSFCCNGDDSIMAGQRFRLAHWKRKRNVFNPSTLMELEAKAVFWSKGPRDT